jgi:hypothetical protein
VLKYKDKRKTIVFFTVNTDIFSNPSIVYFLQKLPKRLFEVVIFSNQRQILPPPVDLVDVKVIARPLYLSRKALTSLDFFRFYFNIFFITYYLFKSSFLVAIDPPGLINAGKWVCIFPKKIKLIYWSFEISFLDELPDKLARLKKGFEISFSKFIDVVLIQDLVRKELLFEENRIESNTRTFLIPVAPSKVDTSQSSKQTNRNAEGKIVILYSGTIGQWTGMEKLLEVIRSNWNDRFILKLHSRFKLDYKDPDILQLLLAQDEGKVLLSDQYFESWNDYLNFISMCDIGLVSYNPIYTGGGLGQNISNIGLSSGKFSSYLSVGKPVITSFDKTYIELRKNYMFGEIMTSYNDLLSLATLISENPNTYNKGAKNLYDNVLNPDINFLPLFDFLNKVEPKI